VRRQVSAATQSQALAALLFLYREVLGIVLPWLDSITRARRPEHVPTVLSTGETERLFTQLEGTHRLMTRLLDGSGMRLMECVRLRVKHVDFERGEIAVRGVKGGKDRVTMLPRALAPELGAPLARVRSLRRQDREGVRVGCRASSGTGAQVSGGRTTSAPSRSCPGIGTSARRWFTRTF
jgi:integrase